MSGKPTDDDDPTLDLHDDMEWNDALEELEAEVEGRTGAPGEPGAAPKQPLYRPKEADETEDEAPTRESRPGTSSLFELEDEYGDMEETRLSDPPKKLLEALEADQTKRDSAFDDLDIDALLDGLEMKDPAPVPGPPKLPTPDAAPSAPLPKPTAAKKPSAPKPWAPPPPKPRAKRPAAPKRPYQPPAPPGAKPPPLPPKSAFKPPAPKAPPGVKSPAGKPPPGFGRATPDQPAPPKGAVVARIKPRRITPSASEDADERTPVVNLQEIGPSADGFSEDEVTRLSPVAAEPRRGRAAPEPDEDDDVTRMASAVTDPRREPEAPEPDDDDHAVTRMASAVTDPRLGLAAPAEDEEDDDHAVTRMASAVTAPRLGPAAPEPDEEDDDHAVTRMASAVTDPRLGPAAPEPDEYDDDHAVTRIASAATDPRREPGATDRTLVDVYDDEYDDDVLPTRIAPAHVDPEAYGPTRGGSPPPLPSAASDDDEPDIVVGADDVGDLGDLDDLDEFEEDDGFDDIDDESTQLNFAPASQAPSKASIIPPEDAGAQAAARTVRYRKPRREFYPLVGRDLDAMHARRELLRALADAVKGPARARLLTATAELCEQLSEADLSTDLYREAHAADPTDVVALRALRRDAIQRGEWQAAAALLEEETKLPLSADARAAAFTLLAEIQLTRLDDAQSAQKSARSALGIDRSSVGAALLLAETGYALGRDAEALTAVEKAVESWEDGKPRSALLTFVGLAAERAGRTDKALEVFAKATESDPDAFDAMLGLARAQRSAKDLDATVIAVARAGEHSGESPLAEAYRRASARIVHLMGKRPPHATALLFDARSVLAHRARADAARDSGDASARAGAIEAWAAAAGGTERALALTTLAEIRADANDLEGAAAALRDAALADNNLNMIRLVREILSRRAGSGSSLARADEGLAGTASTSAAKAVLDPNGTARERTLLAKAQEEGDAPATADVISLDLATAAGDADAVLSGLGREVERASGEQKLGPLLCLATEARVRGDVTVAEALLEQAREVRPGHPVALRALARQLQVSSPVEAARCWLDEASSAGEGARGRAAFAAVIAGHLLANAGQDPEDAFRRALAAVPAHGPAAWALEPAIRARGDAEALAALNVELADAAMDPVERGGRYVRAGLMAASTDPVAAGVLLDRARDAVPEDGILVELALRLSEHFAPADKAALLVGGAETAPPGVRRAMLLRAAAILADGGEPGEASALYRRVLEEHEGQDPLAQRALDQTETSSGEVSRVASRRFDAVKAAEDDDARVHALQELADLDLHERADPASAVLSLQSILEVAPGHLASLRALERYFMDQSRHEELLEIEKAFVSHLPEGPEVAAHARLATRLALAPSDAQGNAADAILLDAARRGEANLWLARHAIGAARAAGDSEIVTKATVAAASLASGDLERAEAALRAAEALHAAGQVEDAIHLLDPALAAAPSHLEAARALAELFRETGNHEGTARAFEVAGRAAATPDLRARLFYEAGVILEDHLKLPEQAAVVYAEAAQANVTHADLFERYRAILEAAGDKEGLATLTERRVAAGGDVTVLAELQNRVAALREQLGDQTGAKEALRAALSFEGENADALKKLAELCLGDQDYRGAAESLIRLARVRKDREELRWVFFTLGTIYDLHMPDMRRAEAAYRRVLKLIPTDVEAMERLANLYEKENELAKSVEMLKMLADNELDPDANRDHRLRLSASLERQGDLRGAENVLEQTRRNAPVDLVVLKGLADLYRRQNAPQALSMHLNRAVMDFRQAIDTDPTDSAAWVGLTEVLDWRGRPDAARVVASAATTVGIQSDQIAALVDGYGCVPGAGMGASSDELDELIASQTIPRAARAIFQMAAEAFEKNLPYDGRSVRAERVSGRNNTWAAAGKDVAHWYDIGEPQIQVTSSAPRVCVPVSASPFTVLVGSDVYARANEHEKRFLLSRAAKIAKSDLVVPARSQPRDLALAIAGLVRSYDPMFAAAGFEAGELDAAARRMGKALGRRIREPLQPLVLEMAGTIGFDPARLGLMACELGDRSALLATGALPAGVSALLRLAGLDDVASLPTSQRLAAMSRVTEARDLYQFALSEIHFDARARAGAAR